ncbi:tetratricopeptide repeat protein [Hydrogenophaga sp.]|uniref:tetratricopeptide repeat protein n=1 Tax=Hydrogenophaga sp. TaxID=1904254 RepID=UPI00391C7E70
MISAFTEDGQIRADVSADPEDWYNLGKALNGVKQFQAAIEAQKSALRLLESMAENRDTCYRVYLSLGDAYFNSRQWDKAKEAYEVANEIEGDGLDSDASYRLSLLHEKRDSEEPPLVGVMGPDAVSWKLLGMCFPQAYWGPDSLELFSIFAPPDKAETADTWQLLGGIYHDRKELSNLAIAAMQKAATLDPQNETSVGYLGRMYLEAQEYELAHAALHKAVFLSSQPHNSEFLEKLAIAAYCIQNIAAMEETMDLMCKAYTPNEQMLETLEIELNKLKAAEAQPADAPGADEDEGEGGQTGG